MVNLLIQIFYEFKTKAKLVVQNCFESGGDHEVFTLFVMALLPRLS